MQQTKSMATLIIAINSAWFIKLYILAIMYTKNVAKHFNNHLKCVLYIIPMWLTTSRTNISMLWTFVLYWLFTATVRSRYDLLFIISSSYQFWTNDVMSVLITSYHTSPKCKRFNNFKIYIQNDTHSLHAHSRIFCSGDSPLDLEMHKYLSKALNDTKINTNLYAQTCRYGWHSYNQIII